MSQTYGFTCGRSASVVLDRYFYLDIPGTTSQTQVVSSYIILPSTATIGSVVYENTAGELMYQPYVGLGYNPICATRILTSATINEVEVFTTASPMAWLGSINV